MAFHSMPIHYFFFQFQKARLTHCPLIDHTWASFSCQRCYINKQVQCFCAKLLWLFPKNNDIWMSMCMEWFQVVVFLDWCLSHRALRIYGLDGNFFLQRRKTWCFLLLMFGFWSLLIDVGFLESWKCLTNDKYGPKMLQNRNYH